VQGGRGPWPVLILLVATVLVPTACVLWFMGMAVRNERLAVRQKLADHCAALVTELQQELNDHWAEKAETLSSVSPSMAAPQVFANLVTAGSCDSALLYDAVGRLRYPVPALDRTADRQPTGHEWERLRRLEHELRDPASAAQGYARLAEFLSDPNERAMALQAQVRCLVKSNAKEQAVELVVQQLRRAEFDSARDTDGRLIVPQCLMLALDQTADDHPSRDAVVSDLAGRLADYGGPIMPSGQRVFLMRRLTETAPDAAQFPTQDAEELAAAYAAAEGPRPSTLLAQAGLPAVWHMAAPGGAVIGLFAEERVVDGIRDLASRSTGAGVVRVEPLPPGREEPDPAPFYEADAGATLPGWRLACYLEGGDPFAAAAARQTALYTWTALIVIAVFALITAFMARYLLGQIRLTRLKNDFIASVTHELKTPLSSMRVLVDMLRDGTYRDEAQAAEYLGMIARENLRLSRLIDSFLTFSRMERNKVAFDFSDVEIGRVVEEVAATVRDRPGAQGCALKLELDPELPTVRADPEALVTVLLNLLDNACKYSQDEPRVVLRTYAQDGHVCVDVADQGIGIPRRALKKVFDRFYQVDRRLSRGTGGCGLGLSIVKFIVDAHGGSVGVRSQPGRGSTFTVRLPAEAGGA